MALSTIKFEFGNYCSKKNAFNFQLAVCIFERAVFFLLLKVLASLKNNQTVTFVSTVCFCMCVWPHGIEFLFILSCASRFDANQFEYNNNKATAAATAAAHVARSNGHVKESGSPVTGCKRCEGPSNSRPLGNCPTSVETPPPLIFADTLHAHKSNLYARLIPEIKVNLKW